MRRLKNYTRILMIMGFILLLTACASKNDSSKFDENTNSGSRPPKESVDMDFESGSGNFDKGEDSVASNRKLIRKVTMEVETLEFDSLTQMLEKEILSLGGYIENSSIQGKRHEYDNSRYSEYVIRIPSSRIVEFEEKVESNANITMKNESTEDITLQYADTESRLKSLEIQQERLLALLEKADTLEEIIALESRLSEVRYELERHGKTLRTYDNLVDYATITLYIQEVVRMTTPKPMGIWERIGTGLSDTIYNIYIGFTNFFVSLIVNLPYIIIWCGIIAFITIIGLKIRKKLVKYALLEAQKDTPILPEEKNKNKEENRR